MRNLARSFTAIATATVLLAGCASSPPPTPEEQAKSSCRALGPKTAIGAGIGAVVGAGLGAAVGGPSPGNIAVGAGLGTAVGGLFGKGLDMRDCAAATAALQKIGAAKTGTQITWANPSSGTYGRFVPTSEIQVQDGRQCRNYTEEVTISGKTEQQNGVTCRTPEGDWERYS